LDQLVIAAGQRTRERQYWLEKLRDASFETRFPVDLNKKHAAEYRGETVDFAWPEKLSSQLIKLGAGSDVRLYIILAAGLTALLHRYLDVHDVLGDESEGGGRGDIVLGAPVPVKDTTTDLINSLLVFRNTAVPGMTFKKLLLGVRQTVADAFDNQNYPLEVLAEQLGKPITAGHPFPLFDIAVVLENIQDHASLEPLNLGMAFCFNRENNTIKGRVKYDSLSYTAAAVDRVVRHLERFLTRVGANVDTKLSEPELMSPEEKERLLIDFNDTAAPYPMDETIHGLFEKQADKTPQAIAVVDAEGNEYSYRELDDRADGLAAVLRERGVEPGTIAAIMVDRSPDIVTGILAILKTGAAYLPMEPGYPAARVRYILADSGAKTVVTHRHISQPPDLENIYPVYIEDTEPGHFPGAGQPVGSNHIAYIIYTSGSTGRPKGVAVEHGSAVNLLTLLHHMYPLGPEDTYLLKTSFVFDVSVSELFGWFLGGGKLAVLEPGGHKDPGKIAAAVERFKVTHINFVPPQFNAFTERLDEHTLGRIASLKYIFLAGEALPAALARRFMKAAGTGSNIRLENLYGPTEATVYASGYSLSGWDAQSNIPIGKPLANTRLYILDAYGGPQPIGAPGELCIAGAGAAEGYLNRPELTAEKFRTMTFQGTPSQRLYHTGDLARWLPGGNVEYLGRLDHQVKIRGFRIELGEIEEHLLRHPAVRECVVTVKRDRVEDPYLLAYIVPAAANAAAETELEAFLSAQLPDYMVPAFFINLPELPLTPAGKVDRKALPAPGADEEETYEPPETPIQEQLVAIWADVLGREPGTIGIDHNFFRLGGHSLKATALVYRIYRGFNAEVEMEEVFKNPTVRLLSRCIRPAGASLVETIPPIEKKAGYELSYAQRRLWVLCQFEEDSTAYNMPGAFVITGAFKPAVFEEAVRALAGRHESLRTLFQLVDGEPRQKILDTPPCPVEFIALPGLTEAEKEEQGRRIYSTAADTPFDLVKGPLFRFIIVRLAEQEYLVVYNVHHIVNDGWSLGVMYNELITLYNARLTSAPHRLPCLKLQYKDYSHWHNQLIKQGRFDRAGEYWLEKFKDRPNGIELPLDHSRPPVQTFNGGRVSFSIDPRRTTQLMRLCQKENATLFMGLLGLMDILLYKYSGQRDMIIGSPIAGRKVPDLQHMIGFLVNTLIYRIQMDPAWNFPALLRAVKQDALACYKYQDYPFDLLVERLELDRDMSQSPLFNVMLAHNNADTRDEALAMAGAVISAYAHGDDFNLSKFDLIFFMDESHRGIDIRIEYNSDLLERGAIERMAANFSTLLTHVLSNPDEPVPDLKYIHEQEYETLLNRFNATARTFPAATIPGLLEPRSEKSPDTAALVMDDRHITYALLHERANRLAHYLRRQCGIKPNDVVGISFDRSEEMVVAILGVIKSGAAYAAIDPTYPEDNVLHMLKDSRVEYLLIDRMRPRLFGNYQGTVINLLSQWELIETQPVHSPEMINKPGDIVYVIYTSGSTGMPNGAMLSHGILSNLVQWQHRETGIDGALRCLQFTSINFCVSFQEIMTTLSAGGQVYLIDDIKRQDVEYLMAFLSKHRIGNLYLPFSYLNFLSNELGRRGRAFRHGLENIITAGEQLKVTAGLKRFLEQNPGIKLHNHYGSSEMHVVTSFTLDGGMAGQFPVPPAGKPVANTRIYISDEYHHPVPIGVWGELKVSGSHEVSGYINNPELSRRKLLQAPFLPPGAFRLYQSGDIGRWREDGNIELQGRKDFQVKVRGFRVDLGEIESKLLSLQCIDDCAAAVRQDLKGQKYLLAYVVTDGASLQEIKNRLAGLLPRYMLPRLFELEKLPLMPNGKVDRDQLPEPPEEPGQYIAPVDPVHKQMALIWQDILDIEKIGIHDDFFETGGHSLLVQKLINGIQKSFDVPLKFQDVFQWPTIAELSDRVRQSRPSAGADIPALPQNDHYALSYVQKRLWYLCKQDPLNPTFNLTGRLTFSEEVDAAIVEKVFQTLIRRHESFRTSFKAIGGDLAQVVHGDAPLRLETADFSHLPPREKEEQAERFIRETNAGIFDLEQAPLLRVAWVKYGEGLSVLTITMHHIISDGWSLEVLDREFHQLYRAYKGGKEAELTPLSIQYKDYAAWHNQLLADPQKMKDTRDFWKERSHYFKPLGLPYDFPHTRDAGKKSAGFGLALTTEEVEALTGVARRYKASLFMILLAGFNMMLARISGERDILIGFPGAARQHDDVKDIIGCFVNTIVLSTHVDPGQIFSGFLEDLQQNTLNVLEYQSYPLELICDELGIDYPRLSVFFNMSSFRFSEDSRLEDFGPRYREEVQTAKFDLVFYIREYGNGLEIDCHYFKHLFNPAAIEVAVTLYREILKQIAADPGKVISQYRPGRDNKKKRRKLVRKG
jgi:tyrocidine synthetase-3